MLGVEFCSAQLSEFCISADSGSFFRGYLYIVIKKTRDATENKTIYYIVKLFYIFYLVPEVFYNLSVDEDGHCGIKANGLYEQTNNFNFFFGLKLASLILTDTEKLSRIIQASTCCLQNVLCANINVCVHFIQMIITKISTIWGNFKFGKQIFREFD